MSVGNGYRRCQAEPRALLRFPRQTPGNPGGNNRNQNELQQGGYEAGREACDGELADRAGNTKSVSQGGKHYSECYQPCLGCVCGNALKSDQGRTEYGIPEPARRAHGSESIPLSLRFGYRHRRNSSASREYRALVRCRPARPRRPFPLSPYALPLLSKGRLEALEP